MKFSANSKFKLFLTITLAVIVVGFALISIFGFNKTLEYKDGYEITFGIEQNLSDKAEQTKNAVDSFLSEKGIKVSSIQSFNDGTKYIYKLDNASKITSDELKTVIENALNDNSVSIITSVNEVKDVNSKTNIGLLWTFLVVIAVVFVYLFFVEKLKNTITVFAVSSISTILFIALLGLTRIPVYPTLMTTILTTFAFSACLSTVVVNRFRILSNNSGSENASSKEISDSGINSSLFRLTFVGIATILFAIAFMFSGSFMLYIGLQIIVCVIASMFTTIAWTPVVWSSLRLTK